jgi:hypothetical protein
MGMIFPRDPSELQQAPKLARIPLVYVVSRGNRDNRPVACAAQLAERDGRRVKAPTLPLRRAGARTRERLPEIKGRGRPIRSSGGRSIG